MHPLNSTPKGTASELSLRWERARRAALQTLVPDAPRDLSEVELVGRAAAVDAEAATRRVFDNSRVLGQGFSRFTGLDLPLPDLLRTLPPLGIPCAAAGWSRAAGGAAAVASRPPCEDAGVAWCAHWREATTGLVNGLSSAVWFSRVRSPTGGSTECRDLLHVDPWSPLRFDPVPDELASVIDVVAAQLLRVAPGADVAILGMAEGALHVRVESAPHPDLGARFAQALRRAVPELVVRDASARSVLSPHQSRSSPCPSRAPAERS